MYIKITVKEKKETVKIVFGIQFYVLTSVKKKKKNQNKTEARNCR